MHTSPSRLLLSTRLNLLDSVSPVPFSPSYWPRRRWLSSTHSSFAAASATAPSAPSSGRKSSRPAASPSSPSPPSGSPVPGADGAASSSKSSHNHPRLHISAAQFTALKVAGSKSLDSLEAAWKDHVSSRKGPSSWLGAVIPSAYHHSTVAKRRAAPNFVLPLPGGPGGSLTSFFCQAQHDGLRVLCTPLEQIRRMGTASATPDVVFTYYEELISSCGAALMLGEIHPLPPSPSPSPSPAATTTGSAVLGDSPSISASAGGRSLSIVRGMLLANLHHLFYLQPEKFRLVEKFNHNPSKFQFQEVIDMIDTLDDDLGVIDPPQ